MVINPLPNSIGGFCCGPTLIRLANRAKRMEFAQLAAFAGSTAPSAYFPVRMWYLRRKRQQASRGLIVAVLCIAALSCLAAGLARAENAVPAFEAANKLYEEGKFAEAAGSYGKLLDAGHASAALYFNWGNALLKSGQIGRAIAAYRQAQRLAPREPDTRANLRYARSQVPSPTCAPNAWQRGLSSLTLNEWTMLAAGVLWVWLLLLAGMQWRPGWKPALKGFALPLGLAVLLSCGCLGAALYQDRFARVAIVVEKEAVVRFGPLPGSQTAFTVHDGAELRVLDQKDEWLQVTTDPRRIGWIRKEQVAM
jgi:tetratricopeptide (TPR) repeat protein